MVENKNKEIFNLDQRIRNLEDKSKNQQNTSL